MIHFLKKTLYAECDENTCLWKCKVTDLQDQVKILQHEVYKNNLYLLFVI